MDKLYIPNSIFITGIAGFIGFHLAEKLIAEGYDVSGIDNFNDYYDPKLKRNRAAMLRSIDVQIYENDIETVDWEFLEDYDAVIHLAAHAGVRYSLEHPQMYIDTNISATQRLIHRCEELDLPVVYASSSSVDSDLLNPYAWSKFVNEKQFQSSSLTSVGLRFFTVYGEYGRPDMALGLFAAAMSQGKPIDVYNHGDMQRDFTYVGDIVQGINIILDNTLNAIWVKQHEIYNLGTGVSNELMDYIRCLEDELGRVAQKNYLPMHPADVKSTQADISKTQKLGYEPTTSIRDGIKLFVDWHKEYYKETLISEVRHLHLVKT
jgi:UDP-glucuronate 4-epimerase|tara:strand:+ start:554 stop:1513 length:960 start_codon:yes stop_codon:yes gene_type:complete